MKFEQYQLEIQYIFKVFHAIHKKFLTAIDHMDYHPLQMHNVTRIKKEVKHMICMDNTIPNLGY